MRPTKNFRLRRQLDLSRHEPGGAWFAWNRVTVRTALTRAERDPNPCRMSAHTTVGDAALVREDESAGEAMGVRAVDPQSDTSCEDRGSKPRWARQPE